MEALLPGAFPRISKQSLPDCIPKRSLGTRRVGDVIPGSGGCRKVRWNRAGFGKSGGVRIIYFNRLAIFTFPPRLHVNSVTADE